MSVIQMLFWFLSVLAIVAAIGVISSKNPVYSVLWLIVVFFAISGHYILLNAQFLAIVNIIVYAGAIMVLFLFVIMQNLNATAEVSRHVYLKIAGVISGMCLLIVFVAALSRSSDINTLAAKGGSVGLIKDLGMRLFNDYVIPFEISSVLFLSAMIGAVIIGKKDETKKITF